MTKRFLRFYKDLIEVINAFFWSCFFISVMTGFACLMARFQGQ